MSLAPRRLPTPVAGSSFANPARFPDSSGDSRALDLDPKRAVLLNRGFLLFHAAHVGPTRAAIQDGRQLRQLVLRTRGVHFHPPVIQIAGEAGEAKLQRRPLGEVAIPDALHAPADQPSPRCLVLAAHSGERIPRLPAGPARPIAVQNPYLVVPYSIDDR